MRGRVSRRVVVWTVVGVVAAGGVVLGRVTTGPGYDAGYLDGLQAGLVSGRQEGRALEAGDAAPPASRQSAQDAFSDAYAAGANDVFSGYDGGWALDVPYVVTLKAATPPVTYRIASRSPLLPGVSYVLCPNGRDVCQEPRR